MNTPEALAIYRQEKARSDAQRKQDERRAALAEYILAAVLAVLVGLIAV